MYTHDSCVDDHVEWMIVVFRYPPYQFGYIDDRKKRVRKWEQYQWHQNTIRKEVNVMRKWSLEQSFLLRDTKLWASERKKGEEKTIMQWPGLKIGKGRERESKRTVKVSGRQLDKAVITKAKQMTKKINFCYLFISCFLYLTIIYRN